MNKKWHVIIGDFKEGPFSELELADLLSKKIITSNSFVWNEATKDWEPLGNASINASKENVSLYESLLALIKTDQINSPKDGAYNEQDVANDDMPFFEYLGTVFTNLSSKLLPIWKEAFQVIFETKRNTKMVYFSLIIYIIGIFLFKGISFSILLISHSNIIDKGSILNSALSIVSIGFKFLYLVYIFWGIAILVKIYSNICTSIKESTTEIIWTTLPITPMLLFTTVVYLILTSLGFLLFIVPGIIIAVYLSMSLIICIDGGIGIKSLKYSWRLVSGYWWEVAIFILGNTFIVIGASFLPIIGTLVAIPFVLISSLLLYYELQEWHNWNETNIAHEWFGIDNELMSESESEFEIEKESEPFDIIEEENYEKLTLRKLINIAYPILIFIGFLIVGISKFCSP